ncbi:uncharacterized protein LOC136065417 [Quercus suber]|uniref:uncharacterized protein LOC136065417 n=1 Tax=Quercus suber TaxID=58331 RepID=UPI0032DE2D30
MRQLMRCTKEYKRLEDDQQQSKGKAPATPQYMKDSQSKGFQPRTRRELRIREPSARSREISVAFKELGHITEQCRVIKDHLEQLVKSEQLKEFVAEPESSVARQASRSQGNTTPPPLGVIEVIHAASIGTSVSRRKGVLSLVSVESAKEDAWLEKKAKCTQEPIALGDDDLEGTTQPYDDALVVTA